MRLLYFIHLDINALSPLQQIIALTTLMFRKCHKNKGVAGAGRLPSLLIVAIIVPSHFNYYQVFLVSILIQLNCFTFTLVLESRLATLDIRKYLYDPPNKVALKSSLYILPLLLIQSFKRLLYVRILRAKDLFSSLKAIFYQ